MSTFLQKNPRLLLLVIGIILVAGSVAFSLIPRMEDPRLTPRAARVTTLFPADAERVESLVSEKLEESIREVEEVKVVRSISSTNVSVVIVELVDEVYEIEAENAWSRIRDKIEDASKELPATASDPEFEEFNTANALILSINWEHAGDPNFAIMHRLAKELQNALDRIPGTEQTELFGVPEEEILVTLDPEAMTSLGLTPMDVSRAIAESDSKISAGLLRTPTDNFLLEVAGEFATLQRIGQIPIQYSDGSNFVLLSQVAEIEKTVRQPLESKALIDDHTGIALGAQINPQTRIDRWSSDVDTALTTFEQRLPAGVSLVRVFEQETYVASRMQSLVQNLAYGAIAIFVVILCVMGLRAALVVGLALPLVSLIVLALMHWMSIPIHQMSVTGLIIALGLMIDNAIVVVDEIATRIRKGASREAAVRESTAFLLMPLAGSTLTTALSFSPIILMQGPSGEFVGAIAVVAVLSVVASFVLALTVVATLAALYLPQQSNDNWISHGISSKTLGRLYRSGLQWLLRIPALGILIAIALPILGFLVATTLPEQFFPPAERSQFQIELDLSATSSIDETERYARQVRELLLQDSRIERVQWFLGESAPMFYYNVIPLRRNAPQYGQAIVDCAEGVDVIALIREKQREVDSRFPDVSLVLQQLEQGPPFEAPIEIRLSGPDNRVLRSLGDQVRLVLSETEHVHHTRAGLSESLPKISFVVDEQQARLAGLNHLQIAQELNSSLEGITGGSLVEATEELPVRVRVSGADRGSLDSIASLDLLIRNDAPNTVLNRNQVAYRGLPLSAIGKPNLVSETVRIDRRNGQRINEVQAFIEAGILPSNVLLDFEKRFKESGIAFPPGYSIAYGGAESERNDAVGALIGNVFVIVALMIATLVVSLASFRFAGLLFLVAGLSIGLGLGGLWLFGFPWGFMSMVAMMGMIGVAVNDSIVVLASILEIPKDKVNPQTVAHSVAGSTRHIVSTTLTTIVGFTPLFLYGGDLWRPVAVAISCGVGGATILALVLVPCSFMILRPRKSVKRSQPTPATTSNSTATENPQAEKFSEDLALRTH